MIGSRSDRLPGFEKKGARSVISVNPPSIAPHATGTVDITVTGARITNKHLVVVVPPPTLEAGLVALSSEITANDTARLTIRNDTDATIDGAARDWEVFLFKRRAT